MDIDPVRVEAEEFAFAYALNVPLPELTPEVFRLKNPPVATGVQLHAACVVTLTLTLPPLAANDTGDG